jgi:hypothetical protein
MNLHDIICEAKCCSGNLALKWTREAVYGNGTEETFYNLLRINFYIRILERNEKKVVYEKEKIPFENQIVSFSMLKKKNSFLTLELKDKHICVRKEVEPCLTDFEISEIIEQVRLLCSICNPCCN